MNDKIIKFISSEEYDKKLEEVGSFLNITWEDERMSKIILLMDSITKYNLLSENQIKETTKKWLDFLNEEQINSLYNYLQENFLPKVKELWQEEEEKKIETATEEETFAEKEKKYVAIMENLIKNQKIKLLPQKEKKPLIKEETKEIKTITFVPEKKHHQEKEEKLLPESVIIIKKKEENEKQKFEDEELLDLSKL